MKNTANYNFKKPENTDLYNVQDFSDNMDAIDTALKALEDGTTPVGNANKLGGKGASEYALKTRTFMDYGDYGYNYFDKSYDLNDWIKSGVYGVSSSCTNTPDISSKWGTVLVAASSTAKIMQIYKPWNSSGYYYRFGNSGDWGVWVKLADESKVLPLTGGTLTGNLTVDRNSYPSLMLKNTTTGRQANVQAGDSNTAGLYNFKDNSNQVNFYLYPETTALDSIARLRVTKNGADNYYNVLHTGNGIKVYKSLSELGLTEATATPEAIVKAMADNSMLTYTMSGDAMTSALAPPFAWGFLRVHKINNSYAMFECQNSAINKSLQLASGYYNVGNVNAQWSGWHKVADADKYLPLDGSVPMSGANLLIGTGYGRWHSDNNSCTIGALKAPNNTNNMRSVDIFSQSYRPNITNALQFRDTVNGAMHYYDIHHDGNSAKVVVSSTPLTAEGSVRVW